VVLENRRASCTRVHTEGKRREHVVDRESHVDTKTSRDAVPKADLFYLVLGVAHPDLRFSVIKAALAINLRTEYHRSPHLPRSRLPCHLKSMRCLLLPIVVLLDQLIYSYELFFQYLCAPVPQNLGRLAGEPKKRLKQPGAWVGVPKTAPQKRRFLPPFHR
jgi:hypothetical protein